MEEMPDAGKHGRPRWRLQRRTPGKHLIRFDYLVGISLDHQPGARRDQDLGNRLVVAREGWRDSDQSRGIHSVARACTQGDESPEGESRQPQHGVWPTLSRNGDSREGIVRFAAALIEAAFAGADAAIVEAQARRAKLVGGPRERVVTTLLCMVPPCSGCGWQTTMHAAGGVPGAGSSMIASSVPAGPAIRSASGCGGLILRRGSQARPS
jgi:hypothetical protein